MVHSTGPGGRGEEADEAFRALFEAQGDVLLIADPETHALLDASPAASTVFGYTHAELLTLRAVDLVHPNSIDFRAVASKLYGRVALDGRRKDGSAVPLQVSAFTYAAAGSRLRCIVAREIEVPEGESRLVDAREALRARQLAALLQVSRALGATVNVQSLLDVVLDELAGIVPYSEATIAYEEDGFVYIKNYRGPQPIENVVSVRAPSERAPVYQAVRRQRGPVIVHDTEQAAWLTRPGTRQPTLNRSILAVPLRANDRIVGMLRLDHAEPGFYTSAHADLALAIANQASVAIENARLFELSERRRRQLEALARADAGLYRTLRPREVLQALVDAAKELLGANKSSVLLWDAQQQHLTLEAIRGFQPESVGEMSQIAGDGIGTRAATTGQIVDTEDAQNDPCISDRLRAVAVAEAIRGMISVPIKLDGDVFGVFNLHYQDKRSFSQDVRQLLQMFAQRAAVAFQNARLYEAERTSRERLDVALQAGKMGTWEWTLATSVVTWSPQLEAIHGMQPGTFGGTFDAYLQDVHPEDLDHVRRAVEASLGSGEHHLEYRIVVPDGSVRWLESHGRVIREADGKIIGMRGVCQDITGRKQAEAERIRLQERERSGSEARAALEERQRLARELHDSVSQALYGIALGTQTALGALGEAADYGEAERAMSYTHRLAEAAMSEMRALILELRPETLEQEGLVAALQRHVDALRSRHGLDVRATLGLEPALGLETKEALYRICQEALHNAVKHARATRLELRLLQVDGRVIAEVIDNGVGFDPAMAYPGHLGLVSMRERAAVVAAELDVDSAPGAGTRIRVNLPA